MKPLDAFQKLVDIDPSALSYFYLGKQLYIDKKYKEALRAFEACIELDANFLMGYLLAGQACEKMGASDQAKQVFEKGKQLAKENNDQLSHDQFSALLATF